MKSSSLQLENIKPTYLEQMESWVHKHPTVIKVVKMAGLILGMGLLIVPFLTAGFGTPASTCFVILERFRITGLQYEIF